MKNKIYLEGIAEYEPCSICGNITGLEFVNSIECFINCPRCETPVMFSRIQD